MAQFKMDDDPQVTAAIEEAARAACKHLDSVFPGNDAGGITSNFQGHLVEYMKKMLRGGVVDVTGSHFVPMPTLIVNNSFFGKPVAGAKMYLVIQKQGDNGQIAALDSIYGEVFKPLSKADDAYTSFEAAAEAAAKYISAEGLSMDEAKAQRIQVRAVDFAPSGDGFALLPEPGTEEATV